MSHRTPSASVIVPLTGGPSQALRCCEGLAVQPPHPEHEVIIVDNASIGLQPLLDRLQGDVTVVRSDRRVSLAAATRLGAERAAADRLVLIRAAAAAAEGWLAPLIRVLDDERVGLATSVDPARPKAPVPAAWAASFRRADLMALPAGDLPDELLIGTLALTVAQRGATVRQISQSAISAPGARSAGARRPPGERPELTIVIPTLDATSDRVRGCVAAIAAATDAPHEIVIIDNGSPPQGFSSPVNAGIRAARTPYIVVMNDDVEVLPGWWQPLRGAIDAGAAVAFPLTIDGAMRTDFAAWCFAMRRDTVREFGHAPDEFFDPSLVIWYQDTDLLIALQRAGRAPVLVRASTIRHGLSLTVATEDPVLSAWVARQIAADESRFYSKHPDLRPAARATVATS